MSSSDNLRALILQHEDPTPPGLVNDWLESHRAAIDVYRIDLEEKEVEPTAYDLIVSLGYQHAAFDDHIPMVGREATLMRYALDRDVPILGLCFGGQLLARLLGGEVFRSDYSEVGWLPVRTTDPELVPEGPWFQWHFDSFTLPDSAHVVADSPAGPQAFVAGRNLGVQFHPEVTMSIMADWVVVYRHELDAEGVDPDELLAETEQMLEKTQRNSLQMFEHFLTHVAGLGSVEAAR